jgi:hypothetical protein
MTGFLLIAALCLGNDCGSSSNGGGGSGGGSLSGPIEGTYVERYTCRWDDGTCAGVDITIEMEVTDLGNGMYEIDDLGSEAGAIGTPQGSDQLAWTGTDPGFEGSFSETGLWTFDFSGGSTTFVKESTFVQNDTEGECTGSGTLATEANPNPVPDPPPDLPCTQP